MVLRLSFLYFLQIVKVHLITCELTIKYLWGSGHQNIGEAIGRSLGHGRDPWVFIRSLDQHSAQNRRSELDEVFLEQIGELLERHAAHIERRVV